MARMDTNQCGARRCATSLRPSFPFSSSRWGMAEVTRGIFAFTTAAFLLPSLAGCGFPVKYNWPDGLSPEAVRQRIHPGITQEATRAELGQPYEATEITHTWFPTFYVETKHPVVKQEFRDIFWIG